MDNNFIKGVGLLIALAVLLRARYKTKAAKTRQEDVRNYEPIEPGKADMGKMGKMAFSTLSRLHRIYSLLITIGIVTAVLGLVVFDSISRWIILGTAALILLIYTIYKNRKAEEKTDHRSTEFWENRP
jgi:hypothetical protein